MFEESTKTLTEGKNHYEPQSRSLQSHKKLPELITINTEFTYRLSIYPVIRGRRDSVNCQIKDESSDSKAAPVMNKDRVP
jgi:hypothetical protein